MLKNTVMILALLAFFVSPAHAGFEEGKAAYDTKDWAKTIAELRPLAESGDDRAMILLANMYAEGLGVVQNYRESMVLYKRAAIEKNNVDGMLAVAAMYTSGFGVARNVTTALHWFQRAALLGNETGALFYATILFRGNNSKTDDIKPDFYNSYKWYTIAGRSTQSPQMKKTALGMATLISSQKLTGEQIAQANKEAADWRPVAVANLGPTPVDPVEPPPVEEKPAAPTTPATAPAAPATTPAETSKKP